jgi:hypothetical protein
MPVPTTRSNEALQRLLDQLPALDAVVPPGLPVTIEAADMSMPWAERLRSTEAQLRLLSDAYPFTWRGNPA